MLYDYYSIPIIYNNKKPSTVRELFKDLNVGKFKEFKLINENSYQLELKILNPRKNQDLEEKITNIFYNNKKEDKKELFGQKDILNLNFDNDFKDLKRLIAKFENEIVTSKVKNDNYFQINPINISYSNNAKKRQHIYVPLNKIRGIRNITFLEENRNFSRSLIEIANKDITLTYSDSEKGEEVINLRTFVEKIEINRHKATTESFYFNKLYELSNLFRIMLKEQIKEKAKRECEKDFENINYNYNSKYLDPKFSKIKRKIENFHKKNYCEKFISNYFLRLYQKYSKKSSKKAKKKILKIKGIL